MRKDRHAPATSRPGCWLVVLGVLLCGCGREQGERFFPVAGTVQLDGKPLTIGVVSYRPDAERGNKSMHVPTGTIDAQGRYELITIKRKGAPPGWYRVLVFADANTLETGGIAVHPIPPRWLTHEKYTDPKTTDLSVEVVEQPAAGAYDLKVSP